MTVLRRLSRSPRGMTLVELCIVILILGLLLTFAVATYSRARMSGNEASAVASLRAIYTAQFQYLNGCGRGNYATTLIILGTKPAPNSQGYISEDLGSSTNPSRNGYSFSLQPGAGGAAGADDCLGNPTQTKYYASAVPLTLNNTGGRSFATNQGGAVWQLEGGTPPDEPFEPPDQRAQ